MILSKIQVPGVYLFAVSECMNDFGIDERTWLRGTRFKKINASFLETSIDFELFQELVLRAIRYSGNPALGIFVGHRLSIQSHGVLGYALMNSENLFFALKLIEQYVPIRMPPMKLTSYLSNNEFVVKFEEQTPLNLSLIHI